ncbi:MAG: hypothetical protein LBI44_05855 [Oscillospiraceae bacterium]|jgi:hypothetical protein|nr:hypothetical protein [Oscillospiraceae bacterium]
MKKLTAALIALALAAAVAVCPPEARADEPTPFDHNLDYTAADYTVGTADGDKAIFYIDLATELLHNPGKADVAAISYDGGNKWKAVVIPDTGLSLTKAFGRATTIQLTDTWDAKKKKPYADDVKDEAGATVTPKSKIYSFDAIEKRAAFGKIAVNFAVYADSKGEGKDQWVFTLKDSNAPLDTYQIAFSENKKTPGEWGKFKEDEGVALAPLTGAKQTKLTYFARVAPVVTPTRRVPASKPKKFTVGGLGKPTKYKADYKKETIKVAAAAAADDGEKITVYNKETAKTPIDISGKMGTEFRFWLSATAKKPASTPQVYTPAARGFMDEIQPTFTVSSVKINTSRYEVQQEGKTTWGSSVGKLDNTKDKQELPIRMKASVTSGKETEKSYAASAPGKLVIVFGFTDDKNEKRGITDAYIEAPEQEGVLRFRPVASSVSVQEGEDTAKEYTFNLLGLYSGGLPAGITFEPLVTYSPASAKANSVKAELITPTAGDTTVRVKLTSFLPCVSGVGFKVSIDEGLQDESTSATIIEADKYRVSLAGGRAMRYTVKALDGAPELTSVTSTGEVTATVLARATGSLNKERALDMSGIMGITGDGDLAFTFTGYSLRFAYSDTTLATLKKADPNLTDTGDPNYDKGLPALLGGFTFGASANVKHGGTLCVEAVKDGDTFYFFFELRDNAGPYIVSASYAGSTVTVTFNEILKSGQASFEVRKNGASYLETTASASGDTNVLTVNAQCNDPGDYVLHFAGNAVSPIRDGAGNAVSPGQFYITGTTGGTAPLRGVTFANGFNGRPFHVAQLPAVGSEGSTWANGNYPVIYLPLSAASTGRITADGSATYVYSTTLRTAEPSGWLALPATDAGIVGLRAGDYIYMKSASSVYCFRVSRIGATSGSLSYSSGSLSMVNGKYTATLNFNGLLYGARSVNRSDFTLGLAGATVDKLTINGSVITLELGNMGAFNANSGTLSVTYAPGLAEYIMSGSGSALDGFTRQLTNNLPSPSPSSP